MMRAMKEGGYFFLDVSIYMYDPAGDRTPASRLRGGHLNHLDTATGYGHKGKAPEEGVSTTCKLST